MSAFANPEDDDINLDFNIDDEEGEEKIDEPAETADASTTAKCDGDTFKYKPGKPIVSITFSLSSEQPFEVNVGTGITSYKKSDKKAFPVLCEVRDFVSDSVKIEPLKNKACIEKNLPKVLAPILTHLNALLLDQYNAYYETKKYDGFVTAQSEFSTAPTPKPAGEGEEGEKPVQIEGQIADPEQLDRSKKIQTLIQKLKDISTEQIADVEGAKLSEITKQNGIDLDTLKGFLKSHEKEVFPLYLLPLQFYGNQIFMTQNGIVTNGKKIYAYNDISIQKKQIDVIVDTGNWDFIDEGSYKSSVDILNGTEYNVDYISAQLLEKNDFVKGGKRKTLSKKLLKRATRRNRK